MKIQFLDLGKQPIANGFLTSKQISKEYFFNLKVGFDKETCLVSLIDFVDLDLMFNDNYAYRSSMSNTMVTHFSKTAKLLKDSFNPDSVLEIGSNDGVFIKNFPKETTAAVEPCKNFSVLTNNLGYKTHNIFWDNNAAELIKKDSGEKDLIFSANCMCHIPEIDEAFLAIANTLSANGVFVFEDPSLSKMIERISYDQIYDEHAHIFSVIALSKVLEKAGLEIFKVESLNVHGGSNRIYACHKSKRRIDASVENAIKYEKELGLNLLETYNNFAKNVLDSKYLLLRQLNQLKKLGKKIVSYGATSKSTTVFNYCKIGPDVIDYIVDTTPEKQEKLSPGMHIPIVSPEIGFDKSVDIAFLGAWNFSKEIRQKECEFLDRGGKFISHIKI
tara:strand:+ start:1654 stop:2817 length:1164 start_codon:yes stop_codon:yes gene_type:complete